MDNAKMIYTNQEIKLLKESKNLNELKKKRNVCFILFVTCLIMTLKDVFYIIATLYNKQFSYILLFITIVDIIWIIYFIKKFNKYRILIIKYSKINDPKTNPLAITCNEKINLCNNLIDNKESFYVVKKYYIDLRDFLENNKDILPKETYKQALHDLKVISSRMLECDLKR